jgi:hypothetical protein
MQVRGNHAWVAESTHVARRLNLYVSTSISHPSSRDKRRKTFLTCPIYSTVTVSLRRGKPFNSTRGILDP